MKMLKSGQLLLIKVTFQFLFVASTSQYVRADENIINNDNQVYKCCSVQNQFKEYYCDAIDSFSEFDLITFQDDWRVPNKFSEDGTEFHLELVKRNSSKLCRSILQISQKYFDEQLAAISSEVENNSSQESPTFFKNGSMKYQDILYRPSEYCFNRLVQEKDYAVIHIEVFGTGNGDGRCAKQVVEISSLLHPRHAQHEKWIKDVFAAVAGLSFLFTTLNVIIYLSLRNYLNVSGWVEFAYFLALGLFSAFSIPALLYEPNYEMDLFCFVSSVILQFYEIATRSSFFLIAFDIYWMIRKSHRFGSYGEEILDSKVRLCLYFLFLLSIPVGVTTYGVVLNQETLDDESAYWIPHYGKNSCFSPSWPLTEYLLFGLESLTMIVILMSINHIFGRLSASKDMDDPPRISLLSNIFFFTLAYWLMSLLKFARPLFVDHTYEEKHTSDTFWIVLEGFDYAQGVVVFVVFIFNRKTLRAFRKKAGSGEDSSLREIFRYACCSARSGIDNQEEDTTPMSPLMKGSSMRRSTVRQNHLY